MAFFRRVKKRLQGDDPQQLKRELQWLQTQVGRYKGKILAVGLLSLTGNVDAVWWSFPIAEVISLALCLSLYKHVDDTMLKTL